MTIVWSKKFKNLQEYDKRLSGSGIVYCYSDRLSWELACAALEPDVLTNAAQLPVIVEVNLEQSI